MSLNNSERKYFNVNGYKIAKKLIDKKKISQIQKAIVNRSKIYLGDKIRFKSITDPRFHKSLIKLKKNNPKKFGSFYDSVQKSLELYSIVTDKKLISKICKITNLKPENLSFNGENIRMDLPYDELHKLSWHQDRSYYFQNRDGNRGIVCWIPLINITKKLGRLMACKKSHKLGFISKYKKIRKGSKFSTQRKIDFNSKKFEIENFAVNCGDVILLNKNTIHASGSNESDFIRFSLQVRVHDLMDPNYLSFRYRILYNLDDIRLMKKKGVDVSDIELSSN